MKAKLKLSMKCLIPVSTKENGILRTETPPIYIQTTGSKGIKYSIHAVRQQGKKSAFFFFIFPEKVPKRLIPIILLNKEPNPERADGHYF